METVCNRKEAILILIGLLRTLNPRMTYVLQQFLVDNYIDDDV